MKKWMSISAAFLLGVVVTLSAGDVSAQVKSLIGKKVTGEYTVIVNGKTLEDKGAIIESKANVPARAFSEALGADVQVSGKTIYVTTDNEQSNNGAGNETAGAAPVSNKYIGSTKSSLEELKQSTENRILKPTIEGRDEIVKQISQLENSDGGELTKQTIEALKKELATYEADIQKYTKELEMINEALELLKK
ncbi:stalk domain-containing protein [Paenibacillus woosongensis]|uniref:Copper amine oxidase-like N-terminal domain-containing protein n=1 Tax=Paenibacillus woosongensis TaxID=307580 RepID=A0ABQ4MPG6_9BACL|nr:stalk domain-containing protein [Paenibacillus woosongensis]GIP57918.1 hypothetical protein J15TS10_17320 [Paenibacillus woosongensis]